VSSCPHVPGPWAADCDFSEEHGMVTTSEWRQDWLDYYWNEVTIYRFMN
jgi:hypothetical protein